MTADDRRLLYSDIFLYGLRMRPALTTPLNVSHYSHLRVSRYFDTGTDKIKADYTALRMDSHCRHTNLQKLAALKDQTCVEIQLGGVNRFAPRLNEPKRSSMLEDRQPCCWCKVQSRVPESG